MKLSLDADVQKFIDEQVRTGRYATPEDVIHTAIARLREDEAEDHGELSDDDLAALEEGLAQADRGEGRPWEEVRDELRARYMPK